MELMSSKASADCGFSMMRLRELHEICAVASLQLGLSARKWGCGVIRSSAWLDLKSGQDQGGGDPRALSSKELRTLGRAVRSHKY